MVWGETFSLLTPASLAQDFILLKNQFLVKYPFLLFEGNKKLILIEALWEIVLSDGEIHDFESNLIRRLAGLLYISDVNSGNARKRALDKILK